MMSTPILHVAVPSPLPGALDYLAPPGHAGALVAGMRVRVPLGRRQVVGIVLDVDGTSALPAAQLRPAVEILDTDPLLPPDLMALARWTSAYYHHPIGEVCAAALPTLLRQGRPARVRVNQRFRVTAAGTHLEMAALARAPRQGALLQRLRARPDGLDAEALAPTGEWRAPMRVLMDKGWVEQIDAAPSPAPAPASAAPPLNAAQQSAAEAITGALTGFQAWLLDGVTGSGKTEVYLHIIRAVVAAGHQALVLVPEIGLTPQLVARFQERLPGPLAVLHSGLSDGERLQAWLQARDGLAPVIIGTRSAVFTPLKHPGVIILDEEHDPSFKQQDGLRYHARDLAVWRARHLDIPVVLGSATPSLESLHNANRARYTHLTLPQRAGNAIPPRIAVLDLKGQPMTGALSAALLVAMQRHLDAGNQVLLFLNRRGYAPALLCHSCGWTARCSRCDAHYTLHQTAGKLRCHHCGAERRIPGHCGGCNSTELVHVGHGTERVEHVLRARFPDHAVARIDRDSTRNKGALERILDDAHAGRSRILIGTQMLAKGHHLPRVTLVGILNADGGLFSADFRAGERMAQLIVQVAGRAGRAEHPGEVLVQTHHPDHPLFRTLVQEGYHHYAQTALEEREAAALPPYAHLALLRAEATQEALPMQWLNAARALAGEPPPAGVDLWGPVPAPMERRAGRLRAQLLVHATQRADLHHFLTGWLPALAKLPDARRVRWSLDVDPAELL